MLGQVLVSGPFDSMVLRVRLINCKTFILSYNIDSAILGLFRQAIFGHILSNAKLKLLL